MNAKDCRATRREIDESELNQELSEQARSHVASCAACGDFRAERISLRELVGSLEPVAAPGDFEMRLRARLASDRQARTRQPFIFRFVTGTPAIAAAAVLVIFALSLVWFTQRKTVQSPEIAKVPIREAPAVLPPAAPVVSTLNNDEPVVLAGDKNPSRRRNGSRENGSRAVSAGVVARDRTTHSADIAVEGSQRVVLGDLNGDGYTDAVFCPNSIGVHHDRRFVSGAARGN